MPWGIVWAAALGCALAAAPARCADQPPAHFKHGVVIRFEGDITPMQRAYFERKLAVARKRGADLLIVEIDSPGGMVDPSLAIAQRLCDLDWAHTVAYIPGDDHFGALSGASFVALGCDEIVMGARAALGDAGVIQLDENFMFQYVEEKSRTHVVRKARDLAQAKGRPPALVEAMINKDLVVYRATDKTTGQVTYKSDKELEAAGAGNWEKGAPVQESLGNDFLEVNGARAVELGLATATAENRQELAQRFGLAENDLLVLRRSAVDTVVSVLNNPIITGLLFLVGLVALYVEFSAPGIGMGILTAGLCFALFFWSRFLGGTADWLEIVLFLAGLAFLCVELFILPGFGVAGICGVLLLGASLVLASQTFIVPQSGAQLHVLTTTLTVLMGSVIAFFILAVFLSRYFGSLPLVNRLALEPPAGAAVAASGAGQGPASTAPVAVGDVGTAETPLYPAGKARFGTRFVDVITEGDFLDAGTRIRVERIGGGRLIVGPAPQQPPAGKPQTG